MPQTLPFIPSAFLFDMDGVLIDTLSFDITHVPKMFGKNKAKLIKPSAIRKYFARDCNMFWREVLRISGIQISSAERNRMIKLYNIKRIKEKYRILPGAVSLLKKIGKKKIRTALVSNNPLQIIKHIVKTNNLEYFDAYVGNDAKIFKKKPAPDPYIIAAKKLKINPKQCIAVEDSDIGVISGVSAGCFTIGVATSCWRQSALKKHGANITVKNLTEINF